MKLNKQLNQDVLKVYNAYWDGYLKGDIPNMASLLADEYTQVGSAEGEVFSNKKDAVQFLHDSIGQVAGKLEMRNRKITFEEKDIIILIHELCDVFVLSDNEWAFYGRFRATTIMQEKEMVGRLFISIVRFLILERKKDRILQQKKFQKKILNCGML